MPKMSFGLEGSYKHTKSNCSNMLGWNELHFVEGQSGPFIILEEGDQWGVFCIVSSMWLGQSKSSRFDSLKLHLELGMFILDHPLIYHTRPFCASLFR